MAASQKAMGLLDPPSLKYPRSWKEYSQDRGAIPVRWGDCSPSPCGRRLHCAEPLDRQMWSERMGQTFVCRNE